MKIQEQFFFFLRAFGPQGKAAVWALVRRSVSFYFVMRHYEDQSSPPQCLRLQVTLPIIQTAREEERNEGQSCETEQDIQRQREKKDSERKRERQGAKGGRDVMEKCPVDCP